MGIFLSKFLPLWVYPLGLSSFLILLGILLVNRKRLVRISLVLALIVLWVGGNRWVSALVVKSLEWRYLPPEELSQPLQEPLADVIVLLAGATHSAQYPRPTVEINGAGDRMLYAAALYHQGAAPNLLLTGGRIEWVESGDSPAGDMAVILQALGVPEGAMWLEDRSRNTYESAVESWDILSKKKIHRIILVTSAQHMPRSVAFFEAQGFDVIPAPTDYSITEAEWQRLIHPDFTTAVINLIPDAGNLASTSSALKEYLGLFVYWLRGQV